MAKSSAQQAAIAISMKKAGKKPKMQKGGPKESKLKVYSPDGSYKTVVKKNYGEPETIKEKRTVKGIIKGAPKPAQKVAPLIETGPKLYQAKKGGSTPAWQRKEGKSPSGGLNAKGRASLKAEGHDIKAPQPEGGPRKKSFCARMSGMKKKLTSAKTANDPNSRINKSLRKWKC